MTNICLILAMCFIMVQSVKNSNQSDQIASLEERVSAMEKTK
jgi:hypothetical protein